MSKHHRDHATGLNKRNFGSTNKRHGPYDEYALWKRDLEEVGRGRGDRPIVDEALEREIDHASTVVKSRVSDGGPVQEFKRISYEGKGPKNYHRSDEKILDDVCEALYRSYDVDASQIEVEVENGKVYLQGEVYDRQMKRLAEDAVDNVLGVIDVQNNLSFSRKGAPIRRRMTDPEDEWGTRLS